jgi:hypothetical protein
MRIWLAAAAAVSLLLSVAASGCGTSSPVRVATAPLRQDGSWWHPGSQSIEWQWELDHPLRLDNPSDMGLGSRAASGAMAGAPTVYDIDGFDNPASTVAALHHRGAHVICYVEIGAAENYRPDYRTFPASALGRPVDGYPDERYLDIRNDQVVDVIKARIDMCRQKGFDAIEPDIDDSYTDATGFPITEAADIAYVHTLASSAHELGMAWGQKNGDADRQFSIALQPTTDFLLDEQCFEYDTCADVATPYLSARKPVLEAEYEIPVRNFCPRANTENVNSALFDPRLDGTRLPCR